MKAFRTVAEIQASPERVWAVTIDVERWPEWTASVTSVQRLDSGPFAIGSRVRLRQPKLPQAAWQVTELDPIRKRFVWISRSPGVCVTGMHQVDAKGPGSRATLSIEFSGLLGPVFVLLTGALTERYLAIEANGLKRRSESVA